MEEQGWEGSPHPNPTALKNGRTHPGAEQVAIRLLDAANKVPSFCPEQEFTPEESEFRSPVGVGCQRTSSQSSSSPGKTLGRGPAFCSCLPHSSRGSLSGGHLPRRLFWKKPLLSIKEETAKVPSPEGPPSLRPDTPRTVESHRALTWGTTWRAESRGHPLAPSSVDPHSRRSTSPCPVGLEGAEIPAMATPSCSH